MKHPLSSQTRQQSPSTNLKRLKYYINWNISTVEETLDGSKVFAFFTPKPVKAIQNDRSFFS